ncbi:MAG: hypothetical protein BJ554DRAFT_5753 [Olpidium bornovanus]|uniref:Coiled-coil domain-containing protein 39 n=1 Tax=Olpidium bornovanus TaxID=278681 RepID=A0A8H7ZZ48_9FUNG|nr:MAG: hypothetical protein BJ554DRAFT_5753 [Olpidium bornovanus]
MLHDPAAAAAMGPGALPPFANKENRLLDSELLRPAGRRSLCAFPPGFTVLDHRPRARRPPPARPSRRRQHQIKASEAKLAALNSAYDDHVSRANAMKEHMKNVQQEIAHTQRLCDARNREINTEEHFKQLADREKGRLIADIKRCEKEIADLSDQSMREIQKRRAFPDDGKLSDILSDIPRFLYKIKKLNLVQNDIYRTAEKIDSQRTELNLEKEELEEWLRVQSEKDEDNFALLKYTREDEARVKSLTLQIERLVQEVARKRNALSAEVTETQVSQVELDKTTAAFRALHAERQNLLASWEGAIRAMKERDADIEARRRERDALRGDVAAKQGLAAEKQAFLDSQAANNLEIRRKIRACDRTVSKCRSDYQEQQAAILTFQDEVEVLRNTLNKSRELWGAGQGKN